MVIVKLSKKFWVGKICNDRKRTRLTGHVSSDTTQISCNILSFPRSFSSLNMQKQCAIGGEGGEGTKVSRTNYSSIVVSFDRKKCINCLIRRDS